jgi:hypothetical protein
MRKLFLLFPVFIMGLILSFPSIAQFNVNISTGATANMTATNAGSVRTFTANAATANVNIADIIAAYTGGITEVRILTGSTGGTEDGNITFGNAIDYNGIGLGKTLTLTANNTINATQNITDATAGGDLLNLNFTGNGLGASVSTTAGVRMAATFQTNGGNITLVGTQNDAGAKGVDVPSGNISTSGGFLSVTGTANGANVIVPVPNTCDGIDIQSATTNTNGGAITLNGTSSNANGNNGVQIDSPLNSGAGAVTITGISNGNAAGVVNTIGSITATTGNINITGTANSTLLTAVPQVFAAGVSIVSAVSATSGNITINATNSANASAFFNSVGIGMNNGTITTTTGNVTINGTANNSNATATLALGVQILTTITTTSGSMSLRGINNAFAPAFALTNVVMPTVSNGSVNTTNGTINITGISNNTGTSGASLGVLITVPINNIGTGNLTITGESNGDAAAVRFANAPITATGGDITITGTSRKFTTAGADAISVGTLNNSPITNTTGKITLTGYNEGTASALNIFSNLTTTTGDITLNGTSVQGYGIYANANLQTNGGKINLVGEGRNSFGGILGETGRTINSNGGDITMNGVAKSTTSNAVGVILLNTTNSGAGKITITGESNGDASAVRVNNSLTTTTGNVAITGTAKTTTGNGRGIEVLGTILTGVGSVTLNGESASLFPAVGVFNTITTNGGDVTLNGKATNTINNPATAPSFGLEIQQPISTGAGKITLTGEGNGGVSAVLTWINGNLITTTGNVEITGKAKSAVGSARGVDIRNPIITTSGSVTLNGESASLFPATGIYNTITTSGGDVTLNGKATNTSNNPTTEFPNGVEIVQPISTGAGKINITGENNGGVPSVLIWVNGNLTTTSGNIEITGKAKSTVGIGRGVDIRNPIITTSGNVSITGESASEYPGASFFSNITSTSGSFVLKGINSNVTTNSTVPYGIETGGTISTGGNGTISIEGENNANARALLIFPTTTISTVNGDVSIKGTGKSTNNTYVNAIGVDIQGLVNITGTGSITVNGESNANSLALAVFSATTTLRTNTGDINLNGLSKSTVGTLSRAVEILSPMQSSGGKMNIIGESRGLASAIRATFSLINQKDISLLSRRGNISFENNRFIQSTNGGAIDICVAPSYNLLVSGAIGGNSIQTTAGAPINITNGGNSLAVGNATNLVGTISNGTNTIPAGIYTTQNLGNIKINNNLKTVTSVSLTTANINNYTIRVRLEDICAGSLSFANPLNVANFSLANAPAGTSIVSVQRLSNTEALITLGYTGTDDILDLTFPLAQLNIGGTAFNPIGANSIIAIPIAEGSFIPPIIKGTARSQSVDLTWDAVFGARTYEIFGYAAGQPQQLLGTTNENKFTVTGLRNGTTYFFRINAVTSRGTRSGFSNLVELRPSIVLSAEEETLNNTFAVYPNPSNGVFSIATKELKGRNAEISVMDLSGRLVYHQKMNLSGNLETELQLNIASGVYLLQLKTDKEVYQRKVVVER